MRRCKYSSERSRKKSPDKDGAVDAFGGRGRGKKGNVSKDFDWPPAYHRRRVVESDRAVWIDVARQTRGAVLDVVRIGNGEDCRVFAC